jgi:hypothetical protein
MSIWEKLVAPNSKDEDGFRDVDSRGVSYLVKEESLRKVVDFISNNTDKFSDLRESPEATALVLGILGEGLCAVGDNLGEVSEVQLTDNTRSGAVELSEIVGPKIISSDFTSRLSQLDNPEFRESVKRVWGWIQRNEAVLSYLTEVRADRRDGDSSTETYTEMEPSMRSGLRYADEILCSYFSGFMRGYSPEVQD